MRKIETHKINVCNEAIEITAYAPDKRYGNASHVYTCEWLETSPGAAILQDVEIKFQRGPIKEVGTNGVTHEVLLAILIDRMEGFQSGQFACAENATALELLRLTLTVLKDRTAKRVERGVEGTNVV